MRKFAEMFRSSWLAAGLLIGIVPTTSAQDLGATLKKINDSGKITIGHREASVPFSYLDERKQVVGYAVDLCTKVADEVKKVLKKPDLAVAYAAVTPQNRIPLVVDGTVDLECGSTTNTLARQQQVDFSPVYFTTGTRILARKSLGAKEIEGFKGKSVAAVAGSTNEKAIKALVDAGKVADLKLIAVKDYAEGLAALEEGRSDGFATDDIVLFGLMAKSRLKNELEVIGRFLTYDPYGIMFRRNDPDFRLLVTRTLAGLARSGEIEKIYAKWFDPLGVPMSPLLKAAFELQALPE